MGGEAAGGFAVELHGGGAGLVTGLDLAGPEDGFHADVGGEDGLFHESFGLGVGEVFAAPVFFEVAGEAEVGVRPFADHEGVGAEGAELAFDVALHDAHGGHDDDDGEDADEDAEQGEGGAQGMGADGAEGHGATFPGLGEEGDFMSQAHRGGGAESKVQGPRSGKRARMVGRGPVLSGGTSNIEQPTPNFQ